MTNFNIFTDKITIQKTISFCASKIHWCHFQFSCIFASGFSHFLVVLFCLYNFTCLNSVLIDRNLIFKSPIWFLINRNRNFEKSFRFLINRNRNSGKVPEFRFLIRFRSSPIYMPNFRLLVHSYFGEDSSSSCDKVSS